MNDSALTCFSIKDIPVYGRFILAPMDGFTDSPMRSLCRSFGSAVSFSEFLNGIDVTQGNLHLKSQTYFTEPERPFAYQIYDDNAERFLQSAVILRGKNPDIIDINLGCSVRKISNRGAGAGMLREPKKIAKLAEMLVHQFDIPITAKIRLGWDENSRNYIEVSHILEDSGISLITVHGRTRRQEYSGLSDWEAIAEVKNAVKIPVVGNGDISSYSIGIKRMKETGCDAVMIGRAAIGNPWIFANSDRSRVTHEERFAVMQRHLKDISALYGDPVAVLMFRKHLLRYLNGFLTTADIRRNIFSITESTPLLQEIRKLLEV